MLKFEEKDTKLKFKVQTLKKKKRIQMLLPEAKISSEFETKSSQQNSCGVKAADTKS